MSRSQFSYISLKCQQTCSIFSILFWKNQNFNLVKSVALFFIFAKKPSGISAFSTAVFSLKWCLRIVCSKWISSRSDLIADDIALFWTCYSEFLKSLLLIVLQYRFGFCNWSPLLSWFIVYKLNILKVFVSIPYTLFIF